MSDSDESIDVTGESTDVTDDYSGPVEVTDTELVPDWDEWETEHPDETWISYTDPLSGTPERVPVWHYFARGY